MSAKTTKYYHLNVNSPQATQSAALSQPADAWETDQNFYSLDDILHDIAESAGSSISVNGTPVASANLNSTSPEPPSGYVNIVWAYEGSAVSAYAPAGFLNPMLDAGDLIYEDSSLGPARLPIGTSGEVLTVVGGIPAWAATAQSTNFEASGSVLSSDSTVNFEGDGTYISVSNPSAGNVKSVLSISAVQSALASAFDAYGAAATAQSNAESFATSAVATETSRAETAEGLLVPKTTTVNGHALSSSVTVSASDLTTGTLPHGQLPTLVSGDIPNNVANTTGTAGGLSGSPSISITNLTVSGTTSFAAGAIAYAALSGTPTIPSSFAWNVEGNATDNLTLANAGFSSTFNQTSAVAWLWANTTTGTSGTTNASPLLEVAANYWNGSASAQDLWTIGTSLAAGTNGASKLTIGHSGSTGGTYNNNYVSIAGGLRTSGTTLNNGNAYGQEIHVVNSGPFAAGFFNDTYSATVYGVAYYLDNVGNFFMSTGAASKSLNFGTSTYNSIALSIVGDNTSINHAASGYLRIVPAAANLQFSNDTNISRLGAASLAIGNGTAGDFTGSLKLSTINLQTGLTTPFTVALTAQTSSIGATNLVATPVTTSLYAVHYYLNDTTAGTSGTVSVTITWNDGASQTFTSANVTFGVLGAYVSGMVVVKATSGAIQYSTTVTSAVGSPAYSLDLRVVPLS